MQASTIVSVKSRDSFRTDPFFLAARQTLENCLTELTQKHHETQHLYCCYCGPQAVSRLGNWTPAAFIPCLYCCPNDQIQPVPSSEQHTEKIIDEPVCFLPGQLTYTTTNFELLLNVQGFQPHEIKVSVKDEYIEVCAEQQPPFPQNSSRSTVKRYRLPCPVNEDLVQCNLSNDGILLLTAPWK